MECTSGNLTNSIEDRVDSTQINSMIDSMGFSIEWMETGRLLGTYRGVDKRDAYRLKRYDEMDITPDITGSSKKGKNRYIWIGSEGRH